jgi:hypothetical protein
MVERLLIAAPLHLDHAKAVERLGVAGVEFKRRTVATLGIVELVRAAEGGTEFQPSIDDTRLEKGVFAKFLDGGRKISLVELETAEVVADGGELVIE